MAREQDALAYFKGRQGTYIMIPYMAKPYITFFRQFETAYGALQELEKNGMAPEGADSAWRVRRAVHANKRMTITPLEVDGLVAILEQYRKREKAA